MDTTDLRLAAARHSLNLATADELHRVADDLLTRGVYTYSLGELYCVTRPTLWEVAPLFEAALRELGVSLPLPEVAVRFLVGHHLELIAEGREDLPDALQILVAEVWGPLGWPNEVPDCPGRRELVRLYSEYDYLTAVIEEGYIAREEGARRLAEMDQQLAQLAVRWIREHHPCRVDPSWLSWSDGVVRGLADTISKDRAWERLPILADALEEAGCADLHVLDHLRGPGPHVRGCWVIDLLLNKN